MITAIISPLQGKHLATFVVQIERSPAAPLEFFCSTLKASQMDAQKWAILNYRKWLQKELHNFLKQRTAAFLRVGAFTDAEQKLINQLMGVKHQNSLTKTCLFIIQHQNSFRALVPRPSSQQYYWHYTLEEIIKNANDYIMLNQKVTCK